MLEKGGVTNTTTHQEPMLAVPCKWRSSGEKKWGRIAP
jgi:hypothetical protein